MVGCPHDNYNQAVRKADSFLTEAALAGGLSGLHLTVGILVVLICGWCFGAIAEDVVEGDPIVQVDRQIAM